MLNGSDSSMEHAAIEPFAVQYVRAGLALCPVAAGSKGSRRCGWNERENAIIDPRVAAELKGGVGLLHAYSGTMALDIDDEPEAAAWLLARGINLAQLIAAPEAVTINSGRPGKGKLLFRLPRNIQPVETMKISGPNGMVLEFRCATREGKSDQDVLPPSIHPDTDRPYEWGGAGHWSEIPEIPEPLLHCWQAELKSRRIPANDTAPLSTNTSYAPSYADQIADRCAIIGAMRETKGKNQSEPEWRACLGVLQHTVEGDALCHDWSKGHRGYSQPETEEKLSRLRSFGPTTCESLNNHRPEVCAGCKHRGQIRSPISLGVQQQKSTAVIPARINGISQLPHRLPITEAVQVANRFFGYTHDWGERGTYFRCDATGTPFPCNKEEVANAMANRSVVMEDGSLVPLFKVWNSNVNRFEVARVVYAPGLGPVDATGLSILNLYQGLAKRPAAGTWTLMRRHLLHVICRGELKHYLFLLAWMAHLVQKPAEAPGVVVVLRSLMEGAGKTTVVEWLCSIMGRHALMLNDPTQLLTKFNAHLEDKSFIGVNEPSWPGNKDAEAKLKSMITDPFLTIERKHGGVYTVPNNLHFMFTTNAEWAVPAGAGARRYLVLDVDASKAGNHNYFKALRNEVDSGGLEAFLHVLQSFRLDLFDLRSIPITDALRDQQERSLSLEAQWAMDLADREGGSNLGISHMLGREVLTRELYDDYTRYAAARRRYPVSSETFGKYLSRIGVPLHRTGNSRYRVMPTADDFVVLVKAGAGVHQ